MVEIQALAEALRQIESPLLQVLRPGLSRAELEHAAHRHMPWWANHIDNDVSAWYAWHGGVDRDKVGALGPRSQGSHVITPDGVALAGIDELLLDGWQIAGAGYAQELGIVFPIGQLERTSGEFFLHKSSPDAEWTVRNHWLDSGLVEPERADGSTQAPTFRDWLVALAEAINAGRLVLGEYGEITVPGGGVKITSHHLYPWR